MKFNCGVQLSNIHLHKKIINYKKNLRREVHIANKVDPLNISLYGFESTCKQKGTTCP
jgi:hypothetical protein